MSNSPKRTFTVVFEGDLSEFEGNPFHRTESFGAPIAMGAGNAFDAVEGLEARIAELEESVGEVRTHLVLD